MNAKKDLLVPTDGCHPDCPLCPGNQKAQAKLTE
jgi:hypothetical protein